MSQQLGDEPQERQRRAATTPWATGAWAVAAAVVVAVGMVMAGMVVAGMVAGVAGIAAVARVAAAIAMAAMAAAAARAMAARAEEAVARARAAAARAAAMVARARARVAAARARARAEEAVAKEAVGRQSVRGSKLKSQPSPPLSAEKLLLFALPPRISDPIIGDLAEHFPWIQERHGHWFARAWYWRQAVGAFIRFVGPRLAGATSLGALLRVARRLLSR